MPKQTFFNLPAEKRQTFLDVAIAEFAANDFANASVSRIVARAGIAKGSFYQYFENKEDLYRYLLDLGTQAKMALFHAQPPDPSGSLFAYLRQLAQAGVAFELSQPQLSQIGYRAVQSNSLPPEFLAEARQSSRHFFAQLITQAKSQGSVDTAVDEDLAAFVFSVVFTELGRYLMARLAQEGVMVDDGRLPFHAHPAEALLDQVLYILEFGVGQKEQP
ncbi:MAG: TetR/AcrR family transcriptional regulator [Chloroflexi bacterium]|nr:TetR/AcrR family transcriptional regulator [Chloroflexota bacterium]